MTSLDECIALEGERQRLLSELEASKQKQVDRVTELCETISAYFGDDAFPDKTEPRLEDVDAESSNVTCEDEQDKRDLLDSASAASTFTALSGDPRLPLTVRDLQEAIR